MPNFDTELGLEILNQIKRSCNLIISRTNYINKYQHFTKDDSGLEKLDATAMQLIAIGESIKNLDKVTNNNLLSKFPQFEWKKVYPVKSFYYI